MGRLTYILAVGTLLFAGCDNPAVSPDLGYEYFPLQTGNSWTYQVDSIVYDPNGTQAVDTISFQLQEILRDTFTDNAGQLWYRLESWERPDSSAAWTFRRIAALSRDAGRAFRQENNLNLIRFVFPPDEFARWESTAFIDPTEPVVVAGEMIEMFKGWESGFLEIGEESTLSTGLSFSETVLVSHAEFVNLIELRRAEERYAKGVGLVARNWYILDTQVIDGSIPWEEKAEKGFIIHQTLLSFTGN